MNEHIEPMVLRGRVVTPTEVIDDGVVVLRDGLIVWVGEARAAGAAGWSGVPEAAATPVTLLPGLVDVHTHGGGGASYPDATTGEEALVAVLVTAAPDTLRQRADPSRRGAEPGMPTVWMQQRNA